MSVADRLALEHLTVPSATPVQVVELAAAQGCAGATILVAPFGAFPQTSAINLVEDAGARRAVRQAAEREGVALALAYPFVLSRRTTASSMQAALEAAAEVGAKGVGLLVYERDPHRAEQEIGAFCAQALRLNLKPVLEFFGGSAIRTLAEAGVVAAANPTPMGLCVDLLHLTRSGDQISDLATVRAPIVHAQLSDAPCKAVMDLDTEAAYGRLELGRGNLDLASFVDAVPESSWIGVEIPPFNLTKEEELVRAVRILATARQLVRFR